MLLIQTGQDNPILRQKAKKVNKINAEIKQLILDMRQIVESDPTNIGLAAPQVNKSLRIIVVQPNENEKAFALINPEIKKFSRKKETTQEGCLSLPNTIVPVERSVKITAQAINIIGKVVKIKAKDVFARVIQHEIDHLNGILIIDHRDHKDSP
ncbi:MAG: peptide deformylase [Parcubacteria group bacterium]|nr:peptide deformylase [Parcubacteria group bacterium]